MNRSENGKLLKKKKITSPTSLPSRVSEMRMTPSVLFTLSYQRQFLSLTQSSFQLHKAEEWLISSPKMFAFFLFSALISQSLAEIKLVQAVFRHGDRAASDRYPTDPNTEESWAKGYSQLTDQGYDQAIELGNFFRHRYKNFLPSKYNRKDLFMRSSDKDRCIETAMGVSQGLYPGQRIPIHTYSNHWEDLLLKPNSVLCSKADQEERRDKALLHYKLNEEHEEFFHFLSQKTGMSVDMSNVKDLYNTLYREVANNLPQPAWVWQKLANNRTVFEQVVELKRQDRMESFNSFEKSRLRTGFLVHQLVSNIEEVIGGGSKKKMFLYSSHDATLTSLMYSLDISDDQLPPYVSALIFELHEENDAYFVKIFYRKTVHNPPKPLILPGCSAVACPIEEFRSFTAGRVVKSKEEHEILCGNLNPLAEVEEENLMIKTVSSVMMLVMGENLQSIVTPKKN